MRPTWPAVAVLVVGAALTGVALRRPVEGDEWRIYLPVAVSSVDAWPLLNVYRVASGVSPIWTWLVGAIGTLTGATIEASRLLSVASWVAACLTCLNLPRGIRSGTHRAWTVRDPVTLAILCHPIVLVFAVRMHPYVPGLLLLIALHRLAATRITVRAVVAGMTANVQNFMLPAVGLTGLVRLRGAGGTVPWSARSILAAGLPALAGLAGVVANWGLYGGRYPAAFIHTIDYDPYHDFTGFTPGYGPLMLGLAGIPFALVASRLPTLTQIAVGGGVAIATTLLALVTIDTPPLGPGSAALAVIGLPEVPAYAIGLGMLALGWMFFSRSQAPTLMGLVAGWAALSTVPFFYERYVWFVIIPVFIASTPAESDWRPRHGWWMAASLVFAALYLRLGSM